jgi:hypothetical protein
LLLQVEGISPYFVWVVVVVVVVVVVMVMSTRMMVVLMLMMPPATGRELQELEDIEGMLAGALLLGGRAITTVDIGRRGGVDKVAGTGGGSSSCFCRCFVGNATSFEISFFFLLLLIFVVVMMMVVVFLLSSSSSCLTLCQIIAL